jgi:hypothetical protein
MVSWSGVRFIAAINSLAGAEAAKTWCCRGWEHWEFFESGSFITITCKTADFFHNLLCSVHISFGEYPARPINPLSPNFNIAVIALLQLCLWVVFNHTANGVIHIHGFYSGAFPLIPTAQMG